MRIATVAAFGHDGAGPSVTKAPSADTIQDALERILDQDLSEPARPRRTVALGGGVVPWHRDRAIPGTSTVVITDGVDDAPATKMQVITDGRIVTTITQQWRRGPYSWDLVERDYSHGASHYTVKVKHSGSTTGMKTDSISPIFGHGINLQSKPQSLSFFNNSLVAQDPCMGGSFEDPDACADKKQAWNDAKEDLLWSETEVFVACALAPPPIDVPACALVMAHMLRNAQKRQSQGGIRKMRFRLSRRV